MSAPVRVRATGKIDGHRINYDKVVLAEEVPAIILGWDEGCPAHVEITTEEIQ